MFSWFPVSGWLDLVDIAAVAGLSWLAIRYLRRIRGRAALLGLGLLGAIYALARGLELRLTATIFQAFFAVLVLVLIVVFQEDLRRLFEQLGTWRRRQKRTDTHDNTLDLLVRVVARLAPSRTGALIVLPGREPLDRHVDGGIAIHGAVSEPLLLSLFDSSSPGHDGAVLLRDDRVERFAAHLPLSANHGAIGAGGTRHAAALGLAERCDSICVVVSEERGTVSVARDGVIRTLARPEDLVAELRATFSPEGEPRVWWHREFALDAAIAIAGAFIAWAALIPGSDVSEVTVPAAIEIANLPANLEIESIEPPEAQVRIRGLRRDLLLANGQGVRVGIDGYLARLGRRTFTLSRESVRGHDPQDVIEIVPSKVRITVRNAEPAVVEP
jgi:uncharacterized protein (TIGR00159 family)